MSRPFLLVALSACLLAGCDRLGRPAPAPPANGAATLLIAPEDLRTIGTGDASQGPVVTGSIQPARRAELRAEVSGIVLAVPKENGERVKAGDLLVRLDDTAIRDSLASAEAAARAAGQALDQAERQLERLRTLQGQGMTTIQALEDAEVRRNNMLSEQVAARARVVAARQQLRRTEVRAPFDGVVSDRQVSAGDTVQAGMALVKVIDPGSMRFEGLVSADRMQEVAVGRDVRFRVNGYPDAEFSGQVRRVEAAANAATRQLQVIVEFTDEQVPRVAGLYAEGRIAGPGGGVPTVPEGSVVRTGDRTYVWRVDEQPRRLSRVPVELGARDARRGEYPLRAGLSPGDRILRNPTPMLADGQPVELVSAGAAAASAVAAGR